MEAKRDALDPALTETKGQEATAKAIDDYLEWAQCQRHPAQKTALAAGWFFGLGAYYHRCIAEAIEEADDPAIAREELGGDVDMLIKVVRQADRLLNVGVRIGGDATADVDEALQATSRLPERAGVLATMSGVRPDREPATLDSRINPSPNV